MRLKCIKLAGFKSFVDPTTVYFPSNLSAVVGPNGCGKSNTIDAVRWVMGESSAKNLRGDSMTDVIFNGSSGRKPVGQASIELVFDNSEGKLTGSYASFSEISVKRRVTRDGQNNYFLNGEKCRRRDVTDLFLGTGLGPRSYAIIEQGMISKLIEAKPEELRVYIEEAAGISKYKERRRDTENRMRRTKENLERLTDIRDELDRQLARLERQAAAAEKYSRFKEEERSHKAHLQALKYRDLNEQAKSKEQQIGELELTVEELVTRQVSCDTDIEQKRVGYHELSDSFNEVQGRFYAVGADIARIEQSIAHARERNSRLQSDLQQTEQEFREAETGLESDREKAEQFDAELEVILPDLEMVQAAEEESAESLLAAEEQMREWQNEWDQFNQGASGSRQKAEVQQSRIQHLETSRQRLQERINKLQAEQSGLQDSGDDSESEQLSEQLAELELQALECRESVAEKNDKLGELRSRDRELGGELDQLRLQLQTSRGRQASLEALQQAALGQGKAVENWLQEQAMADKPRLADQISARAGWEKAVETVLGAQLQAICVDQLESLSQSLADLESGQAVFIDNAAVNRSETGALPKLAEVVDGPESLAGLLSGIYTADDLNAALSVRSQLKAHESIVTRDGLWLGPNWLRVSRASDAESGVLARKQELEELEQSIAGCEEQIEKLAAEREEVRGKLAELDEAIEQARNEVEQFSRRETELRSQLSARRARAEQMSERRSRVEQELSEVREQLELEAESLSEARLMLQEAVEAMSEDTDRRETLLARRDELREALDAARQRAREDKDRAHELAMREQSVRTQKISLERTLQVMREQVERLRSRRELLQEQMAEAQDPSQDYQAELEEKLASRLDVETELADARKKLEEVESGLREQEQERHKVESALQGVRAQLEQERLSAQTLEVQRNGLVEQLQESDHDVVRVLEELPEDLTIAQVQESLELVAARISRLGAINLAAIDEYKQESERKHYLDRQYDDLIDALETLENAIKRIDRETRTRFKETFDQVNTGLQELFPKVFGGGHAYLELTGEDLLDTGIAIMARPPGKRNSTIHLLSGGEKALTAIALVFSIFRLNPAPFCMLDEVDAPLDDANVGRYARMVQEMSQHVQFIYITHNKIAMEMADQLLGVTMHEPGVSRLVSVNVEEAAELASA
ncbi:chromosome segregation protein SMC [Microbulbifer flavimaris]|uniref:Chromosome partition protein Smc n=1 Tax=Microbulbifer flavimaris TaxID=1781068 RepID=A0ABX4HWR0_9GAMM|nr:MULTISPECIES: chromosome segregation protein SMC [Microbulbifer]KUJ80188.1 chromosome segregation protein SMC [Microbulbifer sp. ZGT114]PCO04253.1 chromosome segregation protein SMC [Microbulbifer flavimaris]